MAAKNRLTIKLDGYIIYFIALKIIKTGKSKINNKIILSDHLQKIFYFFEK